MILRSPAIRASLKSREYVIKGFIGLLYLVPSKESSGEFWWKEPWLNNARASKTLCRYIYIRKTWTPFFIFLSYKLWPSTTANEKFTCRQQRSMAQLQSFRRLLGCKLTALMEKPRWWLKTSSMTCVTVCMFPPASGSFRNPASDYAPADKSWRAISLRYFKCVK